MEINDDHIIELIKGQAATTQAITDLKTSMERGFTFLSSSHEKLDARVNGVEKKVWYGTGVGTTLGAIAGFAASYFHK